MRMNLMIAWIFIIFFYLSPHETNAYEFYSSLNNEDSLKVNDTFDLDLFIADAHNNFKPGLISYAVDMNFEHTISHYNYFAMAPGWDDRLNRIFIQNDNTISLVGGALISPTGILPQLGEKITIGTVHFTALQPGDFDISYDNYGSVLFAGFVLKDGTALDEQIEFQTFHGKIAPVPLPPALLLLSTGFLLVVFKRRR